MGHREYNGDSVLSCYVAYEILSCNHVDCIICDINMPKVTGLEFLKRIREEGSEVPVILYTALDDHDLMLETGQYGAYDFITKSDINGLKNVTINALKVGIDELYKGQCSISADETIFEYKKLLKKI